jgi:hypothetical protein
MDQKNDGHVIFSKAILIGKTAAVEFSTLEYLLSTSEESIKCSPLDNTWVELLPHQSMTPFYLMMSLQMCGFSIK